MSEHDSTWASGASDNRVAGQSPPQEQPPQEHEQRQESALAATPEPVSSAEGQPSETPTTAFPTVSYQRGAYPATQAGAQPSHPTSSIPASGSPFEAPTSSFPAAGSPYQGSTASFPAAGSPYQGPGAPYQGPTQPGAQPGVPYPGAPYQGAPVWTPPAPAAGSGGRLARGVVIGLAAVALSLFSGVAGGFVAHQFDKNGSVTTVTRNAAPAMDRNSVAGVATAVQPSVVDITTGTGEGSGVVISADGFILTNNHVIEGLRGGGSVDVTFNNGKTAKATIVGTDPPGDLALIKAQGVSGLTPAKFGDSDAVQVGDTVLALGSPLGLQGSVTAGIVSALHRTIDEGGQQGAVQRSIGDAIQTDAAINPGNSGGALVNLAGEVIGINTAILTSGQGASGNIGVGFAISSNKAKSTAEQLRNGGKVSHPYLGVQVANGSGGGLIADVVAGGPAEKAGLRKGDLVTKVGSRAVTDSRSLVGAIQAAKPGDQIQLTIVRNGAEQQITATLGESS
jgi:putative serine protease PepD